jgi:hypothetical protein
MLEAQEESGGEAILCLLVGAIVSIPYQKRRTRRHARAASVSAG